MTGEAMESVNCETCGHQFELPTADVERITQVMGIYCSGDCFDAACNEEEM